MRRVVLSMAAGFFLTGCGGATVPAAQSTGAPESLAAEQRTGVLRAQPDGAAPSSAPATNVAEPVRTDDGEEAFDPDAPVTLAAGVATRLRELVQSHPRRRNDVFAKVGDSATVSRIFMSCFATDETVELDGRDELRPHIAAFRTRVNGSTSFQHQSAAAGVGWSAGQVLRGDPSPIAQEIQSLSPRFALVMFGGNDVQNGHLRSYGTRMTTLVDHLLTRGVMPIVSTIPPRNDDPNADREVSRYNAVVRAIAAGRRVPLIDLHAAMERLPQRGLGSDGVHPNAPVIDGRARGCDFTTGGLGHGMNVRNLLTLRVLGQLREALASDAPIADAAAEPTREVAGERYAVLDRVTAVASAHERRYALHVEESQRVAATVMPASREHVNVRLVHGSESVARGARAEAVLEPGDYEVVVEGAGEYLLLVEKPTRE